MENNGNLCKLNVSFVLSSSAVTMLKNTMHRVYFGDEFVC